MRRGARFSGDFCRFSVSRTESSHRYQLSPHHPKIRQREHRVQLGGVLGQAAVARLPEAEMLLDHSKGMLDLGVHSGLELLDLVEHRAQKALLVQPTASPDCMAMCRWMSTPCSSCRFATPR